MSLDTDLQTQLVSLVPNGTPVEENYASEDKIEPRVLWRRSEANTDLFLNGNTWGIDTNYAVEVAGLDIDATASIADTLKTSLHGFKGTMGSSTVLAMFVSDASDDYIPRLLDADESFNVFSFNVQILS